MWFLISSIGNVVITFSIALTIAIWLLVSREWKSPLQWCVLFGLSMVVVLASKIAFIGWGIGSEALDFTGISGHATRAAAVFPVLFYFGLQRAPRKLNSWSVYCGVLLGLLISVSRVKVHAHSGSEVMAGWLLGSLVSGTFLYVMQTHSVFISRRWLVLCSFSLLFMSPAVKPVQTDDVITDLALNLSGHSEPYDRSGWVNSPLRAYTHHRKEEPDE
jgi:membrane-associated phospholipid phosphatase